MERHRAIDADGHIFERQMEIQKYLKAPYDSLTWSTFSMFPSFDGFVRGFSRPGKDDDPDPKSWLGFLDRCGIKETYIYPSAALASGLIQDRDWAVAITRAYNQWVHDSYMKASPRLKPLALIPVQNIPAAVSELRRAVTELGMPGAVLSSVTVFEKHYGHRDYDPIYEEAQRLGCALAIHGTVSQKLGIDQSDNFFKTQTLEHPLALLIQFTDMMADGVFERYPDLRVAFLEAGAGWVPYMMDRMDEGFERRGKKWCKTLTKMPSEYVRGGNLFFSCEVEEKTLPYVLEIVGEDSLMFASDFPHERQREEFDSDIDILLAREDITDVQKDRILFRNAEKYYTGRASG